HAQPAIGLRPGKCPLRCCKSRGRARPAMAAYARNRCGRALEPKAPAHSRLTLLSSALWYLEFGIFLELGVWDLEFSSSPALARPAPVWPRYVRRSSKPEHR